MKVENIIAALCYFSVFFAPFLFPLVVFFVTKDDVRDHAKSALLSHLVPFISIILIVIFFISGSHLFLWFIIAAVLFGLLSLIVFIWNIVKGVKLLLNDMI